MRQLKPELNLLSWGGRHGLDAAECEAIVSHGYCQMEALKIGHPSRSCLSVARLGALAPGLHSLHIWDYRPSPGRETALTNNMPGIATACPKLVTLRVRGRCAGVGYKPHGLSYWLLHTGTIISQHHSTQLVLCGKVKWYVCARCSLHDTYRVSAIQYLDIPLRQQRELRRSSLGVRVLVEARAL